LKVLALGGEGLIEVEMPESQLERCPKCGQLQSPAVGGRGYRLVDTRTGETLAEGTEKENLVCMARGCGMPYAREVVS